MGSCGNIRLKNLYADAVYQLCEIWKEQQEYQQMLELCTKAAEYYPYEEWQVYQIDCLMELEQYEQAYQIYQQTVKRYSDEMGIPPSPRLMERFQKMNGRLVNRENSLMRVKSS